MSRDLEFSKRVFSLFKGFSQWEEVKNKCPSDRDIDISRSFSIFHQGKEYIFCSLQDMEYHSSNREYSKSLFMIQRYGLIIMDIDRLIFKLKTNRNIENLIKNHPDQFREEVIARNKSLDRPVDVRLYTRMNPVLVRSDAGEYNSNNFLDLEFAIVSEITGSSRMLGVERS